MNEIEKIFLVVAILLFAVSPGIAAMNKADQLFQLGNAERTYQDGRITCYLGTLFPGQPIYWCMYPDGSMDHSWFVYQSADMTKYYTGSGTSTYTYTPKDSLN